LTRSATIISLSVKPSDVLFILLRKREEKVQENEPMFGCHLRKGRQLFTPSLRRNFHFKTADGK